MVVVVLISMLVGALASLTLYTGGQADRASASDRNHTVALGVAEAGIHQAIAKIESIIATSYINDDTIDFSGSTQEGTYQVDIERDGDGFIVLSQGSTGNPQLGRSRRVKASLQPPKMFPDAGYALFSSTNLYLKNKNEIYAGDIWANDSLWLEANGIVDGNVTSAQSWIRLEQGTQVTGYVWSGGRKCTSEDESGVCNGGWAIDHTSGSIGKWVKASVSAPTCGESTAHYHILKGGSIGGDATAWGTITGGGTVAGQENPGTCTLAPAAKPAPQFVFNRWNYDPATYLECPSAACPVPSGSAAADGAKAFNAWLAVEANRTALEGTFVIQDCATPRGLIQVPLGTHVAGNVTIITNPAPCPGSTVLDGARVDIDAIDDSGVVAPEKAMFVVVSHHIPPPGAICTINQSNQCAVIAKNRFSTSCNTAMLIYADNGPVAMKNDTGPGENSCGSVIAAGIQMKNNLKLTYDPVFDRLLGFGPKTLEIERWEELPVQ